MAPVTPSPSPTRRAGRLVFVDGLRGLAVIFMILWHTADSWLTHDVRGTNAFALLRLLGGMAAPLFLLLAGVGVGLKVASDRAREVPPAVTVRGLAARGLEILVLGYALRLQMWLVDAGGLRRGDGFRVWVPLGIAIALFVAGLRRLGASDTDLRGGLRSALPLLLPAVGLSVLGAYELGLMSPARLAGLLRVDVLQAIGASIVIVALVGRATGAFEHRGRAIAFGIAATLLTPIMASWLPGPLPPAIAGYLGKWQGPNVRGATLFPIFPWVAYTFVGSAIGGLIHARARKARTTEAVLALTAGGAVLALCFCETLPQNFHLLGMLPALVQPFRVAYRIGLALVLCSVALLITPRLPALRTLGQTSLMVYWVHLEFAFGISARPVKGKLGLLAWGVGFALLTVAMYLLARFRLGPWRRMWSASVGRLRRAVALL